MDKSCDTVRINIDGERLLLGGRFTNDPGITQFRNFVWNSDAFEVGETVLISGDGFPLVGRIEEIYDSDSPVADEQYRIRVSWLSRLADFTKREQAKMVKLPSYIPPLEDEERIVDDRLTNNDAQVVCVLKKCTVTQLRHEADVSSILETQSDGDCPEFIVRFAYDGKKKALRPLLDPTAFEELRDDEAEAPVCFPDWISRDLDYFEASIAPLDKREYRKNCKRTISRFEELRLEFGSKTVVYSRDLDSCTVGNMKYHLGDLVFLVNGDCEGDGEAFENAYCGRIDAFLVEEHGASNFETSTSCMQWENLHLAKEAEELPSFKYIELNGMRLSEPERVYTELWSGITNGVERLTPVNACEKLKAFVTARSGGKGGKAKGGRRGKKKDGRVAKKPAVPNSPRDSVLVLVDELDLLWTRKQKALYNLFDWPNQPGSKLVILAVANTMDLPERILMNRIKSRLGLTRLVFHAYQFQQLREIIRSRLKEFNCFDPDAIQLVSRKVASVSGDARRALNICQKAVEAAQRDAVEAASTSSVVTTPSKRSRGKPRVSESSPSFGKVSMTHVNQVIQETFSEPAVLAIRACSLAEQNFLRALMSEFERTGLQEAKFLDVYQSFKTLCAFDDVKCSGPREALRLSENLATSGIILTEGSASMGIHQRIVLNISPDSIHFALSDFRDNDKF